MSFHYSPKIVTDGLVLYLDAANPKSYPGTGTSWFDLSGNSNNGELINGPTYDGNNGGSLVFDGVNAYIRISLPSTISVGSFSYDAWVLTQGDGGWRTIIDQDNDNWLLALNENILTTYYPTYNTGYPVSSNIWYNIAVSHAYGDPIHCYVNGQLVYTSENSSIIHTTSYYGIGAGILPPTGADEFWSGKISNIKIYNRAVSSTEVLQNYTTLKGRFSL